MSDIDKGRVEGYDLGYAEATENERRLQGRPPTWSKGYQDTQPCPTCGTILVEIEEMKKKAVQVCIELEHQTGRLYEAHANEEEWAALADSLKRVLRFTLSGLG